PSSALRAPSPEGRRESGNPLKIQTPSSGSLSPIPNPRFQLYCAPLKVPDRFDRVKREAGALYLRSILIARIKKRPPWSHSSIQQFRRCPRNGRQAKPDRLTT